VDKYEHLREYCVSDLQREKLDVLLSAESVTEAAATLAQTERSLYDLLKRLKAVAAKRGHSPEHDMTRAVPDGFHVKGVSTYYDEDGNPKGQWVKSNADAENRAEAAKLFVDALTEDVKPRKRVKAPKKSMSDIMVGYPIGDHHFGLYAQAAETGADYDIKIAKECLADAVDYLVDASQPAETALLVNLGDFLHMDNRSNMTPGHGHILDVDTRYSKVIKVAGYGLAHTVTRLLEKHKRVKVVNVPGNHDQDSASWLSLFMAAWFRNEPRVEVETSPSIFLFHQFGKNMVGMTHGHTIKLLDLPQIMAALQPKMWGDTTYRVGWTGHVHHNQQLTRKEDRGAISESFGALVANDAYNASRGYVSQREMHAITFKKSGGVLTRATYNAEL